MSFIEDEGDREFVKASIGAIIKGKKLPANLVLCGPSPCGKSVLTRLVQTMLPKYIEYGPSSTPTSFIQPIEGDKPRDWEQHTYTLADGSIMHQPPIFGSELSLAQTQQLVQLEKGRCESFVKRKPGKVQIPSWKAPIFLITNQTPEVPGFRLVQMSGIDMDDIDTQLLDRMKTERDAIVIQCMNAYENTCNQE
jgi:hypothetical protein